MDTYDFSGIATAYEIPCEDGRVIETGAFDHQEGQVIPIVWRHGHDDIRNVLGHAILSKNSEPPGMRVTGVFNQTKEGRRAKQLVQDKNISNLSIWADELSQRTRESLRGVQKGTIREVSLVLAGKNPGAVIDDVVKHSDDPFDPELVVLDGVIVHTNYEIDLPIEEKEDDKEEEKEEEIEEVVEHENGKTVQDIFDSLNEDQERLFDIVLHSASTGEKTPPSKPNSEDGTGPTVQEVFNTLSEEQKTVLYFMAAEVSQETVSQGDTDMPESTNIFEEEGRTKKNEHLAHEAVHGALMSAIKNRGMSLREVFNSAQITDEIINDATNEVLSHSITNISNFFPDARAVDPGGPQFYAREMDWVSRVLTGVKKRPFARIKSSYADLTPDAARAKGYVTAAQKVEEVIEAFQRTTTPQTVYKLQKLDRDDIIDITEFDVVVWLKSEMRMMLQEEIARAILISDGRAAGADKIVETNIRPIYNDNVVYTVYATYNDIANEKDLDAMTAAELIQLIDFIAESLKDYRGAGSPVFYCQPEVYIKLMLIRDANDQRLHRTKMELADALGVSDIVQVPPMSAMELVDQVNPTGLPAGTYDLAVLGVIVNLQDYVMGQDRGGEVNFFDDFDIDYNKYSYLYETRLSGALVNPYSAVSVKMVTAKTA